MLCWNRDVKLEYKTLKEKVKEFNKKEAKFYGNMFAKLNKLDPHESDVSKFCIYYHTWCNEYIGTGCCK